VDGHPDERRGRSTCRCANLEDETVRTGSRTRWPGTTSRLSCYVELTRVRRDVGFRAGAARFCGGLHSRGLVLAVDDFGTGYPRRGLPAADDGGRGQESTRDRARPAATLGDLAVVGRSSQIGHSLGLDRGRGGVEEDARGIRVEMGCPRGQGYRSPERCPRSAWRQWRRLRTVRSPG